MRSTVIRSCCLPQKFRRDSDPPLFCHIMFATGRLGTRFAPHRIPNHARKVRRCCEPVELLRGCHVVALLRTSRQPVNRRATRKRNSCENREIQSVPKPIPSCTELVMARNAIFSRGFGCKWRRLRYGLHGIRSARSAAFRIILSFLHYTQSYETSTLFYFGFES